MKIHLIFFTLMFSLCCNNKVTSKLLDVFGSYDVSSQQTSTDKYSDLCDSLKSFHCICPSDDNTLPSNKSTQLKRVTLDCSNRDISNISVSFNLPANVEIVNFKGNKLSSLVKGVFLSGENVQSVDFSFNSIDIISHSSFKFLKNLHELKLAHNMIWDLNTMVFDGLNNLETLDLSYNRISNWDQDIFMPCKGLKELNLKYNPILSALTSGAFEHVPQLEKLNLENTGLSDLPNDIFKSNGNLKYLYLAGNMFQRVPNIALQNARSLNLLDISSSQLKYIDSQDFANLRQLTSIHLEQIATLEEIKEYTFQDLDNLESFHCNNNFILHFIHSKAFTLNKTGNAIHLKSFNLRHNAITSLSYETLQWNELHHVDLEGNPWRCDCNIKWLVESSIRGISEEVKCKQPSRLLGRSIKSLPPSDFICTSLMKGDAFLMSLLLFLVIATLSLTGIIFIFTTKSISCSAFTSLFRRNEARYVRVVANKERVDLEWDHSYDNAEP